MDAWITFCPGCFKNKGSASICPFCKYNENEKRSPLVLPHRKLLNRHYVIGRVLGKPGGFGITYLGWDINLQIRVAIKEFLPRDLAARDANGTTVSVHLREDTELFRCGLEKFLQEARALANFDHANVVRVRDFFEENATAYLVMDYYLGGTLGEYLKKKGGKLPEKTAVAVAMAILDGLREVHAKGFLHRDIKPHNIYLTKEGRVLLLDFGAARIAVGEVSRSMSAVLTPGFAPYEQYHRRGEQGSWTDIYACGATLYCMLTGETPPDAPERMVHDTLVPPTQIVGSISPHLNTAIMRALALKPQERPQNAHAFQNLLTQTAPPPERPHPVAEASPAAFKKPPDVKAEAPGFSRLASRHSRLGAVLLDAFILLIPVFLIALGIGESTEGLVLFGAAGVLGYLILQIVLLVKYGQTVGKKAVKIKIVKADSGANGGFVTNILLRGFVNMLFSGICSYGLAALMEGIDPYSLENPVVALIVGYLYPVFDALFIFRHDRRCLHDLLAGTQVVRAQTPA